MAILFTRAWEDDRLDAELLAVAPGERVLVVASAGDAALALAADGADVTAVDLNPDQLRLVGLKLAAAQTLDPLTLHRWFEVGRDAAAPALYRTAVRPALCPADATFWDAGIRTIATGLHEHTGVGQPFARLGRLARLVRPGLAHAIETTPDPAAQAEWWRRHVRSRLFGPLTHALASHTPALATLAPNPRELRRMQTGGWSHGLVDRIDGVVATVLVRRHPWWRPAFSGCPADPGDGAAWLDPDRVASLATGHTCLALVGGDLAAVLRGVPAASLAAVSASNVPDWLDGRGTADLAGAVAHALGPGGRVLVRRVVQPAGPDPFSAAGLVLDPVSSQLVARERTALYETVNLYRASWSRAPSA